MTSLKTSLSTFSRCLRWLQGLRLFRWVFCWRTARWVMFGILTPITIVVVYLTEERVRGQWEWEHFQHGLEAQGLPIHISQIIPPLVRDDQNFAMTPLFRPLYVAVPKSTRFTDQINYGYMNDFDKRLEAWSSNNDGGQYTNYESWFVAKPVDRESWRHGLGVTDVLDALRKVDPMLDEISVASRLPFTRIPIHYELGYDAMNPCAGPIITMSYIFELRALVELDDGQVDRAADDAASLIRLGRALTIDDFVSYTPAAQGIQVVWEGLAAHRWSDAQLIEFQNELQKLDFLDVFRRHIYLQTLEVTESLWPTFAQPDRLRRFLESELSIYVHSDKDKKDVKRMLARSGSTIFGFPEGWMYQNNLLEGRFVQEAMSAFDVPNHHVDVRKLEANDRTMEMPLTPYTVLVKIAGLTKLEYASENAAHAQTPVDEANIACAIERYRLANGKLPETLDLLVPIYIAKIPNDIISGKRLIYRRTSDDNYVLYSVGWNGNDDGGKIVTKKDGSLDFEKSDWVWTYPGK